VVDTPRAHPRASARANVRESSKALLASQNMSGGDTPRPIRARRPLRTAKGFTWTRASNVPGAVLSRDLARRQRDKLREIDETQQRARLRSTSYYVG